MIKIYSDPHFNNVKLFDNALIEQFKKTLNDDDVLIIAGDTFDSFNCGVSNKSFYQYISSVDNKVFILEGNHDFNEEKNALRIINNFASNVTVIEEHSYIDVGICRFHFLNYFKSKDFPKFDLSKDKKNILISHMDLNVTSYPSELNDFDLVINGHEHDFDKNNHVVNIGSMRKTKINESDTKYYVELDENTFEYKFQNFESVIDIKKCFVSELSELKITKPTYLKVLLTGLEDKEKVIKELESNEYRKLFEYAFESYNDKEVILNIDNSALQENSFNFSKIFDDYISLYIEKFSEENIDKKKLKKLFLSKIKSIENEVKFENSHIEFISLEANNFGIFENVQLNFSDYSNGIIRVIGKNHDESIDDNMKSNGSGKSTLFNIIKYTLLGSESGIDALSFDKKKGFSKVILKINDDTLSLERKYTTTKFDLIITINNDEMWVNETNTAKQKMIKERYDVLFNSIKFIFLDDKDFITRFYTSTSGKEKMDIFKDIFSVINSVAMFIDLLKEENDKLNKTFQIAENDYNNYMSNRKETIKNNYSIWKNIVDNKYDIVPLEKRIGELTTNLNKIGKSNYSLSDLYRFKEILSDDKYRIYRQNKYDLQSYFNTIDKIKSLEDSIENTKKSIPGITVNEISVNYDIDIIRKEEGYYRIKKLTQDIIYSGGDRGLIDEYKNLLSKYEIEKSKLDTLVNSYKELKSTFEKASQNKTECPVCKNTITENNINQYLKEIEDKLNNIVNDGKAQKSLVEGIKSNIDNIMPEYNNRVMFDNQLNDIGVNEKDYMNANSYTFNYSENEISNILYYEQNKNLISIKKHLENELLKYTNELDSNKKLLQTFPDLSDYKREDITRYSSNDLLLVNFDTSIDIDKSISNIIMYEQIEKELLELNVEYRNKIENNEKVDKSLKEVKRIVSEANNKIQLFEKRKHYNKTKSDFDDLNQLYSVLNKKTSLTFKEYFVNIFMSKFEMIYNSLIRYMFVRDVKLKFEDFDLKLYDGSISRKYKSFSLGERGALKSCLLFTLNIVYKEYGVTSNIITIDEFLDSGLDNLSLVNILKMVNEIYANNKVFVMSHKNDISELSNGEIIIERKNGKASVL